MYDIKKIKKDLKNNLTDFRYHHILRVAEEARKLANNYNYDEERAYVAALLHDIAREFTEEENKNWIEKYHLSKKLLQKEFRNLSHANIGAVVAKKHYGVENDICNAIKYHTIGNVSMDTLAKIILIADKIGRENLDPQMVEVKKVAYQNLDKAIVLYFEYEKERLKEKNIKLHSDTVELLRVMNNKNSK